jgi:hypothetical protein
MANKVGRVDDVITGFSCKIVCVCDGQYVAGKCLAKHISETSLDSSRGKQLLSTGSEREIAVFPFSTGS